MNKVVVARDGVEALDYLFSPDPALDGTANPLPQMILLDLKLPKLDGLQVLQRIRADERTRLVPVIMLTTSKEETDIVKSYNLGANSYVHKPVDFTQFSEAVRQLGIYWLLLNEAAPGHPKGSLV